MSHRLVEEEQESLADRGIGGLCGSRGLQLRLFAVALAQQIAGVDAAARIREEEALWIALIEGHGLRSPIRILEVVALAFAYSRAMSNTNQAPTLGFRLIRVRVVPAEGPALIVAVETSLNGCRSTISAPRPRPVAERGRRRRA